MRRTRFSCLQATSCRLKETVTLPQATNLVKRAPQLFQSRSPQGFFSPAAASHASSILKGEGVRCVCQDAVAYAFKVSSRSAGLAYFGRRNSRSLSTVLKEKRLVKRALCDLDVNRLVSRQVSIIDISFCLSTVRAKFFTDGRRGLNFPENSRKSHYFRPPIYFGLFALGISPRASTFNRPRSLM